MNFFGIYFVNKFATLTWLWTQQRPMTRLRRWSKQFHVFTLRLAEWRRSFYWWASDCLRSLFAFIWSICVCSGPFIPAFFCTVDPRQHLAWKQWFMNFRTPWKRNICFSQYFVSSTSWVECSLCQKFIPRTHNMRWYFCWEGNWIHLKYSAK